MQHQIAPWPAKVGPETVSVTLRDRGGKPVQGAKVSLEGDMSHPGMRPEFGSARELDAGRYQGTINLTMAGDWVILVHVMMPGGHPVERQIEVKGVRAN